MQGSPFLGGFDRIFDQVQKNLLKLVFIGFNEGQTGVVDLLKPTIFAAFWFSMFGVCRALHLPKQIVCLSQYEKLRWLQPERHTGPINALPKDVPYLMKSVQIDTLFRSKKRIYE